MLAIGCAVLLSCHILLRLMRRNAPDGLTRRAPASSQGAGGVVVKDCDEVLAEHLKRAKALLDRLPHPELRSAPVCQVSATWALDASTRPRSGINELFTSFARADHTLRGRA